jgi:four helix bundle protein
MANKFESLPLFKEAHKLVLSIYKLTNSFPKDEKFGLVSQLRRASSSVVANVIEGNARSHKKEFINFLSIAKGSLEETKYFLLLAHDLDYISKNNYQNIHNQTEIVGKQLTGLLKYWQKEDNLKIRSKT